MSASGVGQWGRLQRQGDGYYVTPDKRFSVSRRTRRGMPVGWFVMDHLSRPWIEDERRTNHLTTLHLADVRAALADVYAAEQTASEVGDSYDAHAPHRRCTLAPGLRYRLTGPVTARLHGDPVTLGPGRVVEVERVASDLAVLRAGHPVAVTVAVVLTADLDPHDWPDRFERVIR